MPSRLAATGVGSAEEELPSNSAINRNNARDIVRTDIIEDIAAEELHDVRLEEDYKFIYFRIIIKIPTSNGSYSVSTIGLV